MQNHKSNQQQDNYNIIPMAINVKKKAANRLIKHQYTGMSFYRVSRQQHQNSSSNDKNHFNVNTTKSMTNNRDLMNQLYGQTLTANETTLKDDEDGQKKLKLQPMFN